MALYAFDGTWNEQEEKPVEDTNVLKFTRAYVGNADAYLEGVGTKFGKVGQILGGVFGAGGRSRIAEMMDKLEQNYNAGDESIDIIGFSRGAALAVHFANKIAKDGISNGEGEPVHPTIRFLGVWDIVGSFGFPKDLLGIDFHDINIGWNIDSVPKNVEHCFQAMAMDERRETFEPERLTADSADTQLLECWFRGVHSDIGGGNGNTKRSDIALSWMFEKALESGVEIDRDKLNICKSNCDPVAKIGDNTDLVEDNPRKVRGSDMVHESAQGKALDVGQSSEFTVDAANRYNWSGVRMIQNQTYRFDVKADKDDPWVDGGINCDANGWESERLPFFKETVVSMFEKRRRHPEANWFELIGTVGLNEHHQFRIGTGGAERDCTATATGGLYTYANDLFSKYKNNKGKMQVSITRIA